MKGLQLRSLKGELLPVSKRYDKRPILAIRNTRVKLGKWKEYIEAEFGQVRFVEDSYKWPLKVLEGFSLDELCKIRYSSIFFPHDSIRKLFEKNAQYEVVWKIVYSMWRWGMGSDVWNEVVEAYNGIRRFVFSPDPDFEVRLDHATYHNERGFSKYSRTYLDGAFAYLIYYRGTHVMTIGFSIVKGKIILIQQVQLKQRTGNRFLFKLPSERLEYVISLFEQAFPGYQLCVVDGGQLTERILTQYRNEQERAEERCTELRRDLEQERVQRRKEKEDWLRKQEEWAETLRQKIVHLETEKPRLDAFYANLGHFQRGEALVLNNLTHYQLVPMAA